MKSGIVKKRKLKIAQLTPYYFPSIGGVEVAVKYISEELAERGHDVLVFTSNRDHIGKLEIPAFEILNGVKIYRFKSLLDIGHMSFLEASFIKKLLNVKADVMHTHVYRHPHSEYASLIGKWSSIPVVLHGHGPFLPKNFIGWKKYFIYNLYDEQARFGILKRINHIIALTKFEEQHYIRLGVEKEKITIVPNAASNECFKRIDPASFISKYKLNNKRIILFVGHLNRAKRPDLLIKTLPELVEKIPNIHLLLIGTDEGMLDHIQQLATSLKMENYYSYLGTLQSEEIKKAFASAELFIIPSDQDALPLVLFEAMAHGLPVVGTDAVGPSEIIDHGITGYIVKRGNVEDLTKAALEILINQKLAKTMGKKAKSVALKKYSVPVVVDQIETIYNRIRH